MFRKWSAALALLMLCPVVRAAGVATPRSVTIYVAPNGFDGWSGRVPEAAPDESDGPLATFEGARRAVAALDKTGLNSVHVQFRGGTYVLTRPERLRGADSGSLATKVVYENYPLETPVLSGGVRVQHWVNIAGNRWQTNLPSTTVPFENLFYNGERRLRPRVEFHKATEAGSVLGSYLRVLNPVTTAKASATCSVPDPDDASRFLCYDRFHYDPSDPISGTWKNLAAPATTPDPGCQGNPSSTAPVGDIELLVFEQFHTSKLRINCIDTTQGIIYLTGPTKFSKPNPTQTGFIPGNRYVVENVQDELREPGQWFLDRSQHPWTLTYLAQPGEDPNQDVVVIPQTPQLLELSDAHAMEFRGLTFEFDNYVVPDPGHASSQLEPDIPAAVAVHNSTDILFDDVTVRHISGTGLELRACLTDLTPDVAPCAAYSLDARLERVAIVDSTFYDIGALGIRIGEGWQPENTDDNSPHGLLVDNTVVEGYSRIIPAAFGIAQGFGHDNLYTRNDVYDGYHGAIALTALTPDNHTPNGVGLAYNTIAYNHVHDLLQGIMNDGGSIRVESGNNVFTGRGNRILNNRIHDTTDASVLDSNGYGGNGVYLDNSTGAVEVANNLVYRVSDSAVYSPHGPQLPGDPNWVHNNIFAFSRVAMVKVNAPYQNGAPYVPVLNFILTNNIFYFDRDLTSKPDFEVQGGCTFPGTGTYTDFQQFSHNLYWRTDGKFRSDPQAFHVQTAAGPSPDDPCTKDLKATSLFQFFSFDGWRKAEDEDRGSVVRNPHFRDPTFPADDFTMAGDAPEIAFVHFDPNDNGRRGSVSTPPPVAPTFKTSPLDPSQF